MDAVTGSAAPAYLLEVLDRGGKVVQRLSAGPGRLAVGRALDNDLILDDPFVDPHHLELVFGEEGVRVEDQGSLNGTWLSPRRRVGSTELPRDGRVHLGHSIIRLSPPGAEVPPALRDVSSHGWLGAFNRPWVGLLCVLLAVLALVLDTWMEETRTLSVPILANQLAYPVLGLLLWSGLWAGINRIASSRANFGVHLAIAALALASLFLLDEGVSLLAFAMGWHDAAPLLVLGMDIAVLGLALFAHLQYTAHGRRGLQALGAMLVSAVLFGSPALGDWLRRDDFSSMPALNPLLKPPAVKAVEGQSIEAFLQETAHFREELTSEP